MKTLSGPVKMLLSGVLGFGLAMAITFARTDGGPKQYDKNKNGIRLLLGGGKKENRNRTPVTEDSMKKALAATIIDQGCYKVNFYAGSGSTMTADWPKGALTDFDLVDISVPKEIGGAMDDQAASGSPLSDKTAGTSSTQVVTFQTVDDLKQFVDQLQPPQ
jgi:hypothetical protein